MDRKVSETLRTDPAVEMSDLYLEIAARLNSACPAPYSRAWIEAEVGPDWDDQTVWCETAGGRSQPEIAARPSLEIGRSLRAIRHQMTVPGQKPWSKCVFTLFPDGKFKFDVSYDD